MENFVNIDLKTQDFIGIVINNDDKEFSGRCQIRVLGLMDEIPDEHLYWAVPMNSYIHSTNGGGNLSVPKKGNFVRVQFNNGELTAPEYSVIQNLDPALIEEIKNDYDGTHVIVYDKDEGLNVIYQKNSGFKIFYKDSFLQISPDSMITLQHKNSDSIIQMIGDTTNITTKNEINITAGSIVNVEAEECILSGSKRTKVGPGPYFSSLLAEPMWGILEAMATAIDAKMPATPGVNLGLVKNGKKAATSSNVKISK